MLEVIRDVSGMKRRAAAMRDEEAGVALVPTMGALHEGHLALIRHARNLRPVVVVSIFVNPAQFGPGEDFARYPRDLEGDCRLAESAGARIVFAPAAEDVYPPGFQTSVEVENLSRRLCGPFRPGHFKGVATVVCKLLNVVRPEVAVFGEKDWQQLAVIRRMAADLELPVEIVGHPLVREHDGLALSSRNTYLSARERHQALCLFQALLAGREMIAGGERKAEAVGETMRKIIEAQEGTRIEYVSVVDPETLEDVKRISGTVLLALAVRIGRTRLIDNMRAASPKARERK